MIKSEIASHRRICDIFADGEFINKLIIIAIPTAMQNLIAAAINMLDTLMIGRVGENEIAAVGIANQVFIIFQLVVVGIYSGGGVYISQFWGKRDVANIRKVLGFGLVVGIISAIAFMGAAQWSPEVIMSLFNDDPEVVELGSKYLKIVSASYIFSAITFAYATSARCVQNAILPMVVSIAALFTNGVFNYALIFGNWGFSAMGVSGAALATLIARAVETVLILGFIYLGKDILAVRVSDVLAVTREFAVRVCSASLPVMLNDLCWVLGFVSYTAAYGRINAQAVASVQISSNIQNLFMVLTFGVAHASSVMVGNKIGEGNSKAARAYAKGFVIIGVILGLILGASLALSARSIVSFFKVSPSVLQNALILMYITSAIMVIRVLGIIFIVGLLRGGGDAKYAFFIEAVTMWTIGVPLTFMGALYFKLPVYLVVGLSTVEELAKFIWGLRRVLSDKWINNLVEDVK